jgi:hypothetical protein
MVVISRKTFVPIAVAACLAITGAPRAVFAQPASAQAAQKNWKDRSEYDLYESITKETSPAKRLELLNAWKDKYPSSDFADARQQLYMSVYGQLGRPGDALAAAGEICRAIPIICPRSRPRSPPSSPSRPRLPPRISLP